MGRRIPAALTSLAVRRCRSRVEHRGVASGRGARAAAPAATGGVIRRLSVGCCFGASRPARVASAARRCASQRHHAHFEHAHGVVSYHGVTESWIESR